MEQQKMSVKGFRASAVRAGLKKTDKPDMALIVSDVEAVAAGLVTTNRVRAASVVLSERHLKNGRARAVIANAGNANACTGKQGMDDALLGAETVARECGIRTEEVLVASTGVIGLPLDMDKYSRAIPRLVETLSPHGIPDAARAIMTTDSFPKVAGFEGEAQGKPYRIIGIAKGAGMIMPHMATLLCFILSDILIEPSRLHEALFFAAGRSFNRISVDGDTSTNDMALFMANGLAGNGPLSPGGYEEFTKGLANVMETLASMIVKDGEGATRLVRVVVRGAASEFEADTAARTISNSSLVKTAVYGRDPNWGRIMAALGRSGIAMREEAVDIWIDHVKIVEKGLGKGKDAEAQAAEIMKTKDEFSLIVDLHEGSSEGTLMTCDLTPEYIAINADYRT